jgi:hypothetical protein
MTVGSPPIVIDDTATPGPGNWEVNVMFEGDLSRHGDTHESPIADINYGFGEKGGQGRRTAVSRMEARPGFFRFY